MGYSKEIYEKVKNQLYNTRIRSEKELEKRKTIFYAKFPNAKKIEAQLASLSISAAREVIKGKNVKSALINLKEKSKNLRKELENIIVRSGYSPNFLEIEHKCRKCKDEGFIDGKMCECMKSLLKQEVCKELNKVSNFNSSTFSTFSMKYYNDMFKGNKILTNMRMSKVLEYCQDYAKNFSLNSEGLFFIGSSRVGKTHLSLAIAHKVIENGYSVAYTSAQSMIEDMEKQKMENGSHTFSGKCYFTSCDLLILDDLGNEYVSSFSNAVIYNVLESRIISKKPNILITNRQLKHLENQYSYAMISRILGHTKVSFADTALEEKFSNYIN